MQEQDVQEPKHPGDVVGKVETSSSNGQQSIRDVWTRKATIEDYVYYAEAQRAAHRWEDGKRYVDSMMTLNHADLSNLAIVALASSCSNSLVVSCQW